MQRDITINSKRAIVGWLSLRTHHYVNPAGAQAYPPYIAVPKMAHPPI